MASLVLALLLDLVGMASALLLGGMVAAVGFAMRGAGLSIPSPLFVAVQAIIGCMIAGVIDLSVGATLLDDWPVFLAVTLATILASSALGYALSRWHVVPGSVAIWGSTPGAATAMVIMAQAYGADVRLVAVMIYTRVVVVTITASVLALVLTGHATAHRNIWTGLWPIDPQQLAITVGVAVVGVGFGKLSRLPAGALLGPLIVGVALDAAFGVHIAPPRLVLSLAFLLVGLRIGLSFTRDTVTAAARAFPRIVLAAVLLVAFCGGLSLLLARQMGIDPVTAYLATSPGGLDSVAIIAASGTADVSFVMALQLVRFVLVMLIGPTLATWLAKREQRRTVD